MTSTTRLSSLVLAGTMLALAPAAGAALFGDKTDAKPEAATPAPPKPSMSQAFGDIGVLAHEVKLIDGRLERLEKSLAGIDKSLQPVGAVLEPAALRALANEAGEQAFERARALILILTACLAGLIVLHAVLRRWSMSPAKAPGSAAK